jgi:hypothetical protein
MTPARRSGKALAAGVAAIGLTIAASASASTGQNPARVIHLHTVLVSATVNSAGNGGVGDVIANLFSVTTAYGQSGHADITCMNFPGAEQLCHAAFVLPDGQLDAQAAIPMTTTSFTAAIIGGTGAYNGATGHIDNTRSPGGTVDRTIYLLPHPIAHN